MNLELLPYIHGVYVVHELGTGATRVWSVIRLTLNILSYH